jgi:hypothetical protein
MSACKRLCIEIRRRSEGICAEIVRAAIVHIVDPLLTYGDGPIDDRVKRRDKRAPGKFSLTAAMIFDPQGLLQ